MPEFNLVEVILNRTFGLSLPYASYSGPIRIRTCLLNYQNHKIHSTIPESIFCSFESTNNNNNANRSNIIQPAIMLWWSICNINLIFFHCDSTLHQNVIVMDFFWTSEVVRTCGETRWSPRGHKLLLITNAGKCWLSHKLSCCCQKQNKC